MGGVGADVQRRRSIAPGAALSFEFDEAVSLGALVLSRVDANDRGLVELADRNVSVVADVTDLSGAGTSRTFAIRALQGDGFEFVRVEVVQSVPATTSATTTDGSSPLTPPTTKTTTVAVGADSPAFVGSLPFWIMIGGIILVVLCCIFITVLVVKLRQRIRDGDDHDDKDVSMQKLGAAPQAQQAGDDAMRRKIEAADLVAVEDISSSTEAPAMQLDGEYDESESYRVVGSVPLHEPEEQEGYESLPIYNYSATGGKTQEIKIHTIVDESTLQRATFAQVIEISESENDDADEARRRQSVILAPVDSDDEDAVITISRVGSMSHANRSSSGKTKKKSLRKSAKRSHK
jgi:hypothetical protein